MNGAMKKFRLYALHQLETNYRFVTINQEVRLVNRGEYVFGGPANDLHRCYLTNQEQLVYIVDVNSSLRDIQCDVP